MDHVCSGTRALGLELEKPQISPLRYAPVEMTIHLGDIT
jgi:hypothetical protein